jgi:hypothetical protein
MKRKQNIALAIVLSAAAGVLTLQNVFAPAPDAITQTPTAATVTDLPEGAVSETCGYVWAHHTAPELTQKIDSAIRILNPAASARAELFGEDCVYGDGHSTFGAMETDFYVHLPADDLSNAEAFGSWMSQVMPIITQTPRAEIQGNYGFAEFWFEKNDVEHLIVRVPIQKYIDEAQGKTGAELFYMFIDFP